MSRGIDFEPGGGGSGTDDQTAAEVSVTPFSTIAATDVQAALEEIVAEGGGGYTDEAAQDAVGGIIHSSTTITAVYTDATPEIVLHVTPGSLGTGALSFDPATQTELDAHLNDTADAHDASAISADSTTLVGTGTDVQAVLEELDNGIADHLADTSAAHAASAISADSTTLVGTGTDVQAVLEELDNGIADHLADAADAHDASAISVVPFASIAATTVQTALEEIVSEGGGGYTDEAAQDAVGGIMQSSTTIAVVYTDATPTIIHHIPSGAIQVVHIGDVELSALGGVASTISTIPYFTGTGTAGVAPFIPGAWNAFTPTLSGGWALGNSTHTAAYMRIGRTIIFSVLIVIGSSATKGTGMTMALPVTAAEEAAMVPSVNGSFHDVGSNAFKAMASFTTSSPTTATTVELNAMLASGTTVTPSGITATSPFTWATGDRIAVAGCYEASA